MKGTEYSLTFIVVGGQIGKISLGQFCNMC